MFPMPPRAQGNSCSAIPPGLSVLPLASRWLRGWACLWLGVLAVALGVRAAVPRPGTELPNTARLEYLAGGILPWQINSNEVVAIVSADGSGRFSLTSDQTRVVRVGLSTALPHTLKNLGPVAAVYQLDFQNLGGDDYDLTNLSLVRDLNGNGLADAGEPVLSSGAQFTLAGGESTELLLIGTVPPDIASDLSARVELKASEPDLGFRVINTDTVIAEYPPELGITKTVSAATASRGDTVSYTLHGMNTGGRATPLSLLVDGSPASYALISDVIPANTTFARFSERAGGIPLYRLSGDSADTWHTAAPADLSNVAAVAIGFPSLPAGFDVIVGFDVTVKGNASGAFTNVAQIRGGDAGTPVAIDSNPVRTEVPTVPPTLTFYRDETFAQETLIATVGDPLHLAVDAAACNNDPLVIETIVIVIESALTKDHESYTAVESAPNSGIFLLGSVPTADGGRLAVVRNDGTLQTVSRDQLSATLEGCGGTLTVAVLQIDPSGIVYDSQTCHPVAGVTVRLIDVTGDGNGGRAGAPATVWQTDGVTPSPNPVVTGVDGAYAFPRVLPSVYRLEVDGTAERVFPSVLPSNCTEQYPIVDGSYGTLFPVNLSTGAVFIDIPIDIPNTTQFGLKKSVSRETVEAGDSVVYTLELTNNAALALPRTFIDDVLPVGFTYEPGSTRRDGARASDPAGGRGPRLAFDLGTVPAGGQVTVSYRVRVERDAPTGEAINAAVVRTDGVGAQSGIARARVYVEDSVFTDKGIVVGKVFLDANRNRVQDPSEPGVPGVRLYLEDGTFAVSDSEGKYSFYGVRPIAHVLKIDRTTLPFGSELIALDTRHARDAQSRFVDLKKGELHKANFAIDATNPDVVREVERRRAQGEVQVAEIQATLRRQLEADARERPLTDIRSLPASGIVGAGGGSGAAALGEAGGAEGAARGASTFSALLPSGTLNSANSSLAPEPVLPIARQPLETFVETVADNAPGFLGLKDGDTLPGRQISVRVKGPLGAKLTLLLNGQPVAPDRLSKRVVDALRQIEALEFLGVDLYPGINHLELVAHDPFGNERARVPISVVAPDQLAKLDLRFSNPEPVADGRTPVRVIVRLLDEVDTPVTARTPLTLESALGRWQVDDLNPAEPGTQVFIEGGRAEFLLLPPDGPGDDRVIVSSGAIKSEVLLPFLPDLRPLIASGILEGTLFFRNGADLALRPTTAADAFEDELRELASQDDLRAGGRIAFFLKGKIKGGVLLTAAYDSDKRARERLFRDIEPDKYYPVYGDSSLRGYDAQSSRRLYLRIDHKRSYLLLGDFQTRTDGEQRALGNYQRSLNGVRGHYENRFVVAEAWASRDTTRQVVEEIPADGTSGPYRFRAANGLINSERVEILTRDRNQPSLIVRTELMQRFVDYEFEPFTGRLLFRDPVRGLDENLNPRSIRVTYEVDQGGDPFWVYGANAQVRLTERLEVGGSYVRDENPLDQQRLVSANATVRLTDGTYVLGEIAETDTDLQGRGLAGRVDLRHKGEKTDARLYYGETDRRFVNPGALLTPGRVEAGGKITRKLTERDNLIVQGLITEDTATTGGKRHGIRADIEHTFDNRMALEVGARWSEETGNPAGFSTRPGALDPSAPGAESVTPFEVNSLRAKLTVPVPHVRDARVFGEYEQDVVVSDQRLAAVGGDWQFSTRGRAYARHEFISSIGGPFELNQVQQNNVTVFGIETDYLQNGQLFNEYRARDAFNGREAEASTGLRHRLQLAPGLRVQAGFERITPFDGTTQNESTAITTGIEYTENPLWKGTARLEVRYADQSDSYLNTLGYARKLSRDWTFLGKTIYHQVDNKGPTANDSLQARVLAGFAWRQTETDVWNALGKYEYRYEDGSPFEPTLDQLRHVHIFSASVNYQPTRNWIFSSRYALKLVDETVFGDDAHYLGQQIGARALRELSKHWDAGVSASLGWSRSFDRRDWAVGPEIGYSFKSNMRLGLGYNVVGFHDRDLTGDIPTQRGIFLNFRLKFDEGFFAIRALADDSDPIRREDF
jgi:uncharacterized repeat protein (TIGR01451 family)